MLLGRPYSLTGKVIQGKERGRSLGFPTANLELLGWRRQTVKNGVYAIQTKLEDTWHNALINIGVRPTFHETEVEHEVHLFDFSGDLYGKVLVVAFIERIREEKTFPDADSLAAQIKADEQVARQILSG